MQVPTSHAVFLKACPLQFSHNLSSSLNSWPRFLGTQPPEEQKAVWPHTPPKARTVSGPHGNAVLSQGNLTVFSSPPGILSHHQQEPVNIFTIRGASTAHQGEAILHKEGHGAWGRCRVSNLREHIAATASSASSSFSSYPCSKRSASGWAQLSSASSGHLSSQHCHGL